jgi:DNA topoisomerase-2
VIPESAKKPKTAAAADDDASDDEEAKPVAEEPDDLRTLAKGYDYLLSMRLWALTRERVDALRGELSEKDAELRTLQATATTDLWLTDLQALEDQLDIDDAKREAGEADAAKKAKAHANKKGKKVQSRRLRDSVRRRARRDSRSRAGRLEASP